VLIECSGGIFACQPKLDTFSSKRCLTIGQKWSNLREWTKIKRLLNILTKSLKFTVLISRYATFIFVLM